MASLLFFCKQNILTPCVSLSDTAFAPYHFILKHCLHASLDAAVDLNDVYIIQIFVAGLWTVKSLVAFEWVGASLGSLVGVPRRF